MNKKVFSFTVGVMLAFGGVGMAMAQTSTPATSTDPVVLQTQIQQLLQQIADLKAQIAELKNNNTSLQGNVSQLKQVIQLGSRMHRGMRGDDVKHLQEALATDSNVLSKDGITGFFGPMTEHAVEHFQKHFGLDPVGEVGPMTLNKLNELLKEKNVTEQDLNDNIGGDLGDIGDATDDVGGDGEMMHGQNASSTNQHEDGGARGGEKRGD